VNRALFLDRDGVLCELVDSDTGRGPRTTDELLPVPGISEITEEISRRGFVCVVVTNQPDIARGYIKPEDEKAIQSSVLSMLPESAGYYICPHDNDSCCTCRKPLPGLIHMACVEMNLSNDGSFFVGDRWTDVLAGNRAGVSTILLRNKLSFEPTSQGSPPIGLKADYEIGSLGELLEIVS
jgi:D-glycero-D-manno-heptose 1,7-bisphosphate phosphatase